MQQQHPVRKRKGFLFIIGNINNSDMLLPAHFPELRPQFKPVDCVYLRQRLIQQKDVMRSDSGPAESGPLHLSHGHGIRKVIGVFFDAHVHCGKHIPNPLFAVVFRASRHPERKANIAPYRHFGIQRIILEYHSHAAFAGFGKSGILVSHKYTPPGPVFFKPGQYPEQRGLACPAWAENCEKLPGEHSEIHVVKNFLIPDG